MIRSGVDSVAKKTGFFEFGPTFSIQCYPSSGKRPATLHIRTSPLLKRSSSIICYTHSFSDALHVGLHPILISHKAPCSLYPLCSLRVIPDLDCQRAHCRSCRVPRPEMYSLQQKVEAEEAGQAQQSW